MYVVVILLQTVVLPIVSGTVHYAITGTDPLLVYGLWWAFWGVGTRLVTAGVSQIVRPGITSKGILGIDAPGADQIVQELGFANLGMGLIALAVPFLPTWGILVALPGALFLGLAGVRHLGKNGKNAREQLATWTDLLVFVAVLAGVVGLVLSASVKG